MPTRQLPGVRLHYTDEGSGPPLMLIHGIGADHKDWEFQIPPLARYYRVIAPDLRGCGLSEKAGDYRVPTFAADLWALLDALGIRQCPLIAHSMGGAVAMQMAIERTIRVPRMVLADTLPSFVPDSYAKRLLFIYRFSMMFLLGPRRLGLAMAPRLYPAPEQEALRQRARRQSLRVSRQVYLETLRHLVTWSIADRLAELAMPVLVLAAEHDYVPPALLEEFAAALPDARYKMFPGMHHNLQLEAPAAFNAAALEFLAGA
jgi:pimeloyl-ACP methyl ester carboxylesterase